MSSNRGDKAAAASEDFIVAPHDICESCGSYSGPKFILSELRDASDLLRRNIILTEQELNSAASNIAYAENEILQLDSEISHLQRSLDALINRLNRLDKFVLREKALSSPIRKLPIELLQKVFYNAQELTNSDFQTAFVRVAIQVSAYWRMVAHSSIELWTNVQVALPCNAQELKRTGLGSFMEKCLSLSKEAPLTICLRGQCSADVLGDRCMRALAESAKRWENITLTNWRLQHPIYEYVPRDAVFSHLVELTIGGVINSEINLNPSPVLCSISVDYVPYIDSHITFQSAPSLTHVDLKAVQNPTTVFSNLPWWQITHFTSSKNVYARDEFCNLLQNMPNLRLLRFDGYTKTDRLIVLQKLQVLQLDGNDATNALGIISAPLLKELAIGRNNLLPSVAEFLRRSQCTLEKLVLHGTSIDETWHAEEFYGIKELHLKSHNLIPLMRGLKLLATIHSAGRWLLFPRLEVFHVEGVDVQMGSSLDVIIKTLIHAVRSRIQPSAKFLKIVNISFEDVPGETVVGMLKEFIGSKAVVESRLEIFIRGSKGALVLST